MCSKIGFVKRDFELIMRFFTTGINEVIPDGTILGLLIVGTTVF